MDGSSRREGFRGGATARPAHYERADVAVFGQLAVDPAHQGRGIGSRLLGLVEMRAMELGVRHLALDTSEHAVRLIDMYGARGYQFVEHAQWDVTNYRSVILSKRLVPDSSSDAREADPSQ